MDKQTYLERLKVIEQDAIWLGKYARDLNKEIAQNMWAVTVPQTLIDEVQTEDLVAFFERVILNRTEQVRKMKRQGIILYIWFDEDSEQLRLNCISDFHKKLPFGCEIHQTDQLDELISDYLTFLHEQQQDDEVNDDSPDEVLEDELDEDLDEEQDGEHDEDLDEEQDEELEEEVLAVYVVRIGL